MMDNDHVDRMASRPGLSVGPPDSSPPHAPVVFEHAFGSARKARQKGSRLLRLVGLLGSGTPRFAHTGRRSGVDPAGREAGNGSKMTGLAIACLGLIAVVACVTAAIALGQSSSLKSDIVTLRRELIPLRERLVKLEQIESTRRDAGQQEEARDKPETEAKAPDGASDQAALNLSREEIQLIREYIKAAPFANAGGPPVGVGDLITSGMIPLPSSLIEKVPRLVGARFATRGGAIIISARNSRRIDAVLTPN